jgi:hypothetical protein
METTKYLRKLIFPGTKCQGMTVSRAEIATTKNRRALAPADCGIKK